MVVVNAHKSPSELQCNSHSGLLCVEVSMINQNWCHLSIYLSIKKLSDLIKNILMCSEDEWRSYWFGTAWGWVINDRILIFGWTIPLSILWTEVSISTQTVCLFEWLDSGFVQTVTAILNFIHSLLLFFLVPLVAQKLNTSPLRDRRGQIS